MKEPAPGKKSLDKAFLLSCGFFLSVFLIFLFTIPDRAAKGKALEANKNVSISLDWDDLVNLARREKKPLTEIMDDLKVLAIGSLSVPPDLSEEDEKFIRTKSLAILWRASENGGKDILSVLARFQNGDGVLPLNESVFGYPGYLKETSSVIVEKNGIFPVVEFGPQKGLASLLRGTRGHWIKTHILPLEEVINPQFELWKARLLRAARERGIRLLLIRLCPTSSLSQDLDFLSSVRSSLQYEGFTISSPSPFNWLAGPLTSHRWHTPIMFLVAFFAPLAILFWVRHLRAWSPFTLFISGSLMSVMSGVCFHSLASSPDFLFGLEVVHGVKLLLAGPLFVSFWWLLSATERKALMSANLQMKHLVWGGVILGVLGGLYLMRSGNYPLISVSASERSFRDGMEVFFGARPRFKEFLFGHPLFLIGLLLQRSKSAGNNFFRDGRLFLLAGLIGQISIINTFTHVHIPLQISLLRTAHGLWLGLCFSIPLGWWVHHRLRVVSN